MRYIWIIFGVLLVAMIAVLPRLGQRAASPVPERLPVRQAAYSPTLVGSRPDFAKADSIVAFGLAQRGTPYVWAGTSPLTGFDCSGFIMYTFAHFGVPVPHSTALLIEVGRPVARAEAQPGDIVVFSGTDVASSTPGHAGIVISRRGERPLRFVHASSSRREPFVKVNQVESSDYERRFMQVRRVLGPGTSIGAVARAKVPVIAVVAAGRTAAGVAAIPTRAVTAEVAPIAPLPKILPKRPESRRLTARKPATKVATERKVATKPVAKAAAISRNATTKPATEKTAQAAAKAPPAKKTATKHPTTTR